MMPRPAEAADRATLPGTGEALDPIRIAGARYRIKRHLGAGTSKEVYQAEDLTLGREVALAFIPGAGLRGATRAQVLREVRTVAQLDGHPHVVTVHDVGEQANVTFVVSQLVRGGSVADWIARAEPGPARVQTAVDIARQIASALAHAHAHGVIHRDVKPSNVLLTRDGTAMLADFGVALLSDRSPAGGADVVGSAAYMPPEQARGLGADERSDIYALGATLYEMVCGRLPFDERPRDLALRASGRTAPDPRAYEPAVSEELAELIRRMLAEEPAERPASPAAVDAALAAAVAAPATLDGSRARAAVPLPEALKRGALRPFVGRDDALEALRSAWQAVAPDHPGLTFLSGEAGIGKTTLASAFARELHDDGVVVLYGRCDEDPLVSYQPFVEALRHLLEHRPALDRELSPKLAPELAELARLVPELRRTPERSAQAGEPQRHLLFEAVAALLSAATEGRPLLLVLDDLQWAPRPTLLLLRHVLRSAPKGAMLVLGTVRTDDGATPDPLADLRSDLRRDPRAEVRLDGVRLSGLDEVETSALVSVRADGDADDAFVRALHATTSGNPFFIEEMLRQLRDDELSAGSLASLGVPEGAQEVIRRRLGGLTEEAVELLTRAAVCGREFRLDILADVLDRPVSRLVGPLEDALKAGLIVEPAIGRFTFCHALVRETLYASVGSDTSRARLHLAVGEALEALEGGDVPASELALHFHAARGVGGADKAVRHALAAAHDAADALAYEEAARHQGRALDALELLPSERRGQRFQVLDSLGRLQWQAGDSTAAKATFRRKAALAREVGAADHLARAALGFGGRWYDAEQLDHELIALLREALAALEPGDGAMRARLMARLAQALRPTDTDGSAAGLNRDALAMARRVGDDEAMIDALTGQHAALLHVEHLDERLALGAEWLALAGAHEHRHDHLALALSWRIYDLFELGDIDAAHAEHARLNDLAQRLRQPLYRNFATSWDFKWLEAAGRFKEASAKANASYVHGKRAQASYADSQYAGHVFGLLKHQGRLPEILEVVDAVMGGTPTLAAWRAGIVLARAEAGDRRGAQADLDALVGEDFASIPGDVFWLSAMCLLAEGAAALGDGAAAAALVARLAPYAERNAQIGFAMLLGPVALFLGIALATAGEREEAERWLRRAIERSVVLGTVTAEVHARCAYAELLPPAEGARDQLAQALATAQRLGMAALARRAEQGLARVP